MIALHECLPVVALGVTAAAAVADYRTGQIPNALTYPALALAPLAWAGLALARGACAADAGMAFLASAGGAFVCGLFPSYQFSRRQLGGGDVKLFAALGAMLGPVIGLHAQFFAMSIAAIWVSATWAWRGIFWKTIGEALASMLRVLARRRDTSLAKSSVLSAKIRLGPAILAGAVCAVAFRGAL
jgi:prepilin peptidase CpaA